MFHGVQEPQFNLMKFDFSAVGDMHGRNPGTFCATMCRCLVRRSGLSSCLHGAFRVPSGLNARGCVTTAIHSSGHSMIRKLQSGIECTQMSLS